MLTCLHAYSLTDLLACWLTLTYLSAVPLWNEDVIGHQVSHAIALGAYVCMHVSICVHAAYACVRTCVRAHEHTVSAGSSGGAIGR